MDTLTIAPLAPLLDRLFNEADSPWSATPSSLKFRSGLADDERERLMRSQTDYRNFYGQLKELPPAVSREIGSRSMNGTKPAGSFSASSRRRADHPSIVFDF